MHRVGEHPVPAGPLAVRWHAWELLRPARAGMQTEVDLVFENAGRVEWTHGAAKKIEVSYHWLDDRGNAIVWGEIWTPLARTVVPGETITQRLELRAPLRAGPHRLAFDLVEEGRYWFSEVGNIRLEVEVDVQPRIERSLAVVFTPGPPELVTQSYKALEAQDEPLVPQGEEAALGHLAPGCEPAADWSRRVLDAHQSGYAVVGGWIEDRLDRRRHRIRVPQHLGDRVVVELRERVEDRRQEEPRQEQGPNQVLDVAEEDVQRRDRQHEARGEADEERRERQCEPLRSARAGQEYEAEYEQDREHHDIRHEIRADDRERDELAREARLADQRCVVEHRARARLHRRREENPRREPREQVERVVRDVLRPPEDAEDEQVDAHQDERRHQHPDDAEQRALVLRLQVAPEEVSEQLPVGDQLRVDRHA